MQTDPALPTSSRRRPPEWLLSLVAYLGLFSFALWNWLRQANIGDPLGYMANVEDRWLVPWVIGWVGHIVPIDPRSLLDVPINYPATGQLTAIEHFLSTGLLVAPIFAWTGNAVLAANVAAIASYPIAAFVMSRLLVAVGCGGGVAWIGGLMFALGPERVPGNLLVLKYLNLYMALVALCLTKLRDKPSPWRAGALALALTAGLFSSYYAAVLILLAGGIWGVAELFRGGEDRWRYLVWAIIGSGIAMGLLVVFSLPYLARPEAQGGPYLPSGTMYETMTQLLAGWRIFADPGKNQIVIALIAILLVWRSGAVGLLSRRGWVITLLGASLMYGPSQVMFGYRVYLPFALLARSPAAFFRYPFRFSILYGLGLTLLYCSTIQAVRERLGRRLGAVAVALLGFMALQTQVWGVGGFNVHQYQSVHEPIYDAFKQVVAEQGGGPLLELPNDKAEVSLKKRGTPRVEVQSMVGWTRHFQPLILGYVDFPPPHRPWLDRAVKSLPWSKALQDIVDMTHVRWILLRPEAQWDTPRDRARLANQPGLTNVLSQDGWDLLRVDRPPVHEGWFDAIRAGVRPGYTVLGTPLQTLRGDQAIGAVIGNMPREAYAKSAFAISLKVVNIGTATWPVSSNKANRVVKLYARWWPAGTPHKTSTAIKRRRMSLTRDVSPGEDDARITYITTPRTPGTYDLELRLSQGRNHLFNAPGNLVLEGRVKIMPKPKKKS